MDNATIGRVKREIRHITDIRDEAGRVEAAKAWWADASPEDQEAAQLIFQAAISVTQQCMVSLADVVGAAMAQWVAWWQKNPEMQAYAALLKEQKQTENGRE